MTKPEYYLDRDGRDADLLNPSNATESDLVWSCHQETRLGDMALLWRTSPKSDIRYLLQTTSDAFEDQNWNFVCECTVLFKFRTPVTIADLRNDDVLKDWRPLRGRFQRRVFRLTSDDYQRIVELVSRKNPDFDPARLDALRGEVTQTIRLERELEAALEHDLARLDPLGYELELVDAGSGQSGRQFVCYSNNRIDLLCYDRRRKQYVVIELKNTLADRNTFGQIASYVGWVEDQIENGTFKSARRVSGLVISRGTNEQFRGALRVSNQIKQIDLTELGFN